jgi:SAM-dependent methyltransferase
METTIRKPLQGVLNIVRFNWHYYAFSVVAVVIILIIQHYFNPLGITGHIFALLIASLTIISLVVSSYIYDFSSLYKLSWLSDVESGGQERIVNINAGFDETSSLLKSRFEQCELFVADFYDPAKHTEVSIRRARKAYPSFPGTQQVTTSHLPVEDNSVDKVFAILAAHEIRAAEERIAFFKELHRVLKSTGKIIVTEHLRDTPNFLAYNIGAFHFHSKTVWLDTFRLAGLNVSGEIKITPFITSFILEKNGTAS